MQVILDPKFARQSISGLKINRRIIDKGVNCMFRSRSISVFFLREGPFSQGASWAVCGSGVPAVRFFKFEWYFRKIGKSYFARETAEKRLDLKSLKGRKKAEELRPPWPHLPSLLPPLKAL